jgi:hypothetical protein
LKVRLRLDLNNLEVSATLVINKIEKDNLDELYQFVKQLAIAKSQITSQTNRKLTDKLTYIQ